MPNKSLLAMVLVFSFLFGSQAAAAELRVGIIDIYEVREELIKLVGIDPANANLTKGLDRIRDEMNRLHTEIRNLTDDEKGRSERQERISALHTEQRDLQARLDMVLSERIMGIIEEIGGGRYAIVLSTDGRSDAMFYKRPDIEIIDLTYDLRVAIIKQFVAAGGAAKDITDDDDE